MIITPETHKISRSTNMSRDHFESLIKIVLCIIVNHLNLSKLIDTNFESPIKIVFSVKVNHLNSSKIKETNFESQIKSFLFYCIEL